MTPQSLLNQTQALLQEVLLEGKEEFESWRPWLERASFRPSAKNLAHYLALRRRDLRGLQRQLMPWGLSSLGRAESRVVPSLKAVVASLSAMSGVPFKHPAASSFFRGERLLRLHTQEALGPARSSRVRAMVTLPNEVEEGYLVELLQAGMGIARLNLAHGNPESWQAVLQTLHQASQKTGWPCRVHLDLPGAKARTELVWPVGDGRMRVGDDLCFSLDAPHPTPTVHTATFSPPEAFEVMQLGQRVFYDEGRLQAQVVQKSPRALRLQVQQAPAKGIKLRPGKSLNFPGSAWPSTALTPHDLERLPFVVQHAHSVGFSFVQNPQDVAQLQEELMGLGRQLPTLALVAKIESPQAVANLPQIMVRAAGRQPFAVMIARGDLAVEVGYERLAEIQEEILWLAEAAHLPVIWATQVLEQLVKKGVPNRAEVTDAAMAERAECVMLNKGPYQRLALEVLQEVLLRMESHQHKKTPTLRALRSWPKKVGP